MDYPDTLRRWNARPFAFDSSRQLFLVGASGVLVSGFDAYKSGKIEIKEPVDVKTPIAIGSMGKLFLLPVGMNSLRYLTPSAQDELRDIVVNSMMNVYVSFGVAREELHEGSVLGFTFGFTRPGHPLVRVMGDCACLGTDASALTFKSRDWPNGYAEFSLHNAPDPRQRTALYAGIGAVASYINGSQ